MKLYPHKDNNQENTPIKKTKTLKILGVTFVQKMTWKTHIEDLKINVEIF